jgi:hypothetical protein
MLDFKFAFEIVDSPSVWVVLELVVGKTDPKQVYMNY